MFTRRKTHPAEFGAKGMGAAPQAARGGARLVAVGVVNHDHHIWGEQGPAQGPSRPRNRV